MYIWIKTWPSLNRLVSTSQTAIQSSPVLGKVVFVLATIDVLLQIFQLFRTPRKIYEHVLTMFVHSGCVGVRVVGCVHANGEGVHQCNIST